jgi:hypothetical protein
LTKLRPGMRVRFKWRENSAFDIRRVPADESDMPVKAPQPVVGEPAPEFRLTTSWAGPSRSATYAVK